MINQHEIRGFAGLAGLAAEAPKAPTTAAKPSSQLPPQQLRPMPQAPVQTMPPQRPPAFQSARLTAPGGKVASALLRLLWKLGAFALAVAVSFVGHVVIKENTRSLSLNLPNATQYTPPVLPTSAPVSLSEPTPGRGRILGVSEIAWCLAEDIRITAGSSVVNSYSQASVDRFNAYVDAYNSRCGDYRYRPSDMTRARDAVAPQSSQFEAEGRARL